MIKRVYALAVLTFKEGVRDRALFGIALFSLAMMAGSIAVVSMFMRQLDKVTADMNLSAITFAGLLLCFFVCINLMSKDIDRHTIYCVMSKPFSRTQYIWGKYFGLMLLVVTGLGILTACSTLAIFTVKSGYSQYFREFTWKAFFAAVYAEILMFSVLNAIIVFFSTITTSSFITLLFSISTYIAGQTIEEVVLFLNTRFASDMVMSGPIHYFIEVIRYVLPNLSVFDIKVRAAHGIFVSWDYLGCISCYAVAYVAVLLISASFIFRRRQL